MKKIGLITYHRALNYGSILQAYALQNYLNNYFSCEILDYQKPNQKEMYEVFKKNNSLKNIIHNIIFSLDKKFILNHRKSFKDFSNSNLLLSETINTRKDLELMNNKYDAFCCGSDQIWNISIEDFDESYFLDFSNKYNFSYAPSLGKIKYFNPFERNIDIKYLLNKFDRISVREKSGQEMINKYTDKQLYVVLDPTLLIEKKQWDTLSSEKYPNEKYIFFYSIEYDEEAIDLVKKFAKKKDLPVYIIFSTGKTYKAMAKGFKRFKVASPGDFISIIKHAEYVISTSFHGTVFSLIYEKEFLLVNSEKSKDDDRLLTLLSHCDIDINSRRIKRDDKIQNFKQLDYISINENLSLAKKKSKEYISKIVNDLK